MNTPRHRTTPLALRGLLVVGCVPMMLAHGALSLLAILPLVSLLGGDIRQAVFLIWWVGGTGALGVLVYSAATYAPERGLARWQSTGLVCGMGLGLPLVFGYAGDTWIGVSAILAWCDAAYLLASHRAGGPPEEART